MELSLDPIQKAYEFNQSSKTMTCFFADPAGKSSIFGARKLVVRNHVIGSEIVSKQVYSSQTTTIKWVFLVSFAHLFEVKFMGPRNEVRLWGPYSLPDQTTCSCRFGIRNIQSSSTFSCELWDENDSVICRALAQVKFQEVIHRAITVELLSLKRIEV